MENTILTLRKELKTIKTQLKHSHERGLTLYNELIKQEQEIIALKTLLHNERSQSKVPNRETTTQSNAIARQRVPPSNNKLS